MKKGLKKYLAVVLLCGVVLGLVSCQTKGAEESRLKEALGSELQLSLTAERQGQTFLATAWLGVGDTMERDMTLVFSEPMSVKGLTVSQKNGQITAQMGTLTLKEDAVRQILLLLAPFSLHSYAQSTAYREGENFVYCYLGQGESMTYYLKDGQFPHKIVYTVEDETILLYPKEITKEDTRP